MRTGCEAIFALYLAILVWHFIDLVNQCVCLIFIVLGTIIIDVHCQSTHIDGAVSRILSMATPHKIEVRARKNRGIIEAWKNN